MKRLLTILTIMLFSVGCKTNHIYFPERKDVLTDEFNRYENFFPIATLDLSNKGIKDKIHVIYVSFDPSTDLNKPFPNSDYIDVFSFKISEENKLHPTFDKSALTISKDFKKYFIEGEEKFKKAKKIITLTYSLIFPKIRTGGKATKLRLILQANQWLLFANWIFLMYLMMIADSMFFMTKRTKLLNTYISETKNHCKFINLKNPGR